MLKAPYGYGYMMNQTYDIGIYLNTDALMGSKIKSLTVKVFNEDKISSASGWASRTLNVSKDNESIFTPDIALYDATIKDGVLVCEFQEPIEIPVDGIYVGYSLTVDGIATNQSVAPVAVVDGSTPGGLWIHSTQTQKRWTDLANRDNIMSAMTLTLEGSFWSDAATIALTNDNVILAENEPGVVEAVLTNWGINGVESIDYTYTIDNTSVSGNCELMEPLSSMLGSQTLLKIPVETSAKRGEYYFDLLTTKVNDVENQTSASSVSVPLIIQAFVPKYRPLVEEYTGLTCGWCPRGYVMLEQMKQTYGNKFVALSYHSSAQENGAMCCINPGDFPVNIKSYPAATIDRGAVVDPRDIPVLWRDTQDETTFADITVDISWKDENKHTLRVVSKARFLDDISNSDYLFSIALVADELSNVRWVQSNAYSDYEAEGEYAGPFWNLFVGKNSHVVGLTYNDVVVHYTDMRGIDGSLPSEINAEEWYEYEFEFDTDQLVNLSGEQFINDFNRIRAVSMIVDKNSGIPINCISSIYPDHTSPSSAIVPNNDMTIIKSIYYDLQGRKADKPGKGLWIRYDLLSDGSNRTSKIIY